MKRLLGGAIASQTSLSRQTICCESGQLLQSRHAVQEHVEGMLDALTGEQMLQDVRLTEVMKVRARLLAGADRDLVLGFPGLCRLA